MHEEIRPNLTKLIFGAPKILGLKTFKATVTSYIRKGRYPINSPFDSAYMCIMRYKIEATFPYSMPQQT